MPDNKQDTKVVEEVKEEVVPEVVEEVMTASPADEDDEERAARLDAADLRAGGGYFRMSRVHAKDRGLAKELIDLENKRTDLKLVKAEDRKPGEYGALKTKITELKKKLGLTY